MLEYGWLALKMQLHCYVSHKNDHYLEMYMYSRNRSASSTSKSIAINHSPELSPKLVWFSRGTEVKDSIMDRANPGWDLFRQAT